MTTSKHVNEKEYNHIKQLKQVGLTVPQATKVTGRSYGTVSKIYGARGYAEFHPTKPKKMKVPSATVSISKQLADINRKLDTMIELNQTKRTWRG